MFGSNKKEANKSKGGAMIPSSTSHSLNSLVKGTSVEGTVRSESDIRIDGMIKGKLLCKAKVIIGPSGFVQGEIRCQNAVIEGKFEGEVYVSELLNIREKANIKGAVQTHKLIVQSGAIFNVNCQMGKVDKPSLTTTSIDKTSTSNAPQKKETIRATKAPSA